jgi:polycystin 1L2
LNNLLQRPLGSLNYIKIWHDNSGQGDNASWYLKHIIVNDLQSNEKFYFICEKWMAVEKEDGKLERVLFVACEPQRTEFKYLLQKQARESLTDSHLWLSIFNRPVNSTFKRLDRVTCGFVFIYLSMLLNIFYYQQYSSSVEYNTIDFVLFKISTEQVNLKMVFFHLNPNYLSFILNNSF